MALYTLSLLRRPRVSGIVVAKASSSLATQASTGMPVSRSIRIAFVKPGVRLPVRSCEMNVSSHPKCSAAFRCVNPRRAIQSISCSAPVCIVGENIGMADDLSSLPSRLHAEISDHLPSRSMVEVYGMRVQTKRLNQLVKENIDACLQRRRQTRKDLAFACGNTESWISKIFRNPTKELPVRYWDRIADFLGLDTYQLLLPGISHLTERRSGSERRAGQDRRIGQAARHMRMVGLEIDTHHPRRSLSVHTSPYAEALDRLNAEHARKISLLLSQIESGRQVTGARGTLPASPERRRKPRGSDAQTTPTRK